MIDAIQKLYEVAGIEPEHRFKECKKGYTIGKPCNHPPCIRCDSSVFEDIYPPFTAEKQLELIKWLVRKKRYKH